MLTKLPLYLDAFGPLLLYVGHTSPHFTYWLFTDPLGSSMGLFLCSIIAE